MKKLSILCCLFIGAVLSSRAQSPKVPNTLFFADIRLDLTSEAQKKIQTDVNALTRYEKYFNAKVERIDAYFPLIEQILREENVPEDIKYLVIQESALVGDAVSSSNAVGYWQFKTPSAREVGLTINSAVDERMNIITATRGAARYFKNNNAFFDNWLHALMAYYEGPGGALKKADKRYNGKKQMRLDGRSHWYILKYLAHKIAFEGAIGRNPNPPVQLFVYTEGGGQTMREVAEKFQVSEEDLQPYNTWLKQRKIPTDKSYPVIVPDFSGSLREPLLADEADVASPPVSNTVNAQATSVLEGEKLNSAAFPTIENRRRWGNEQLVVNGIPGAIAREGEDVKQLARRTGVSPSQLVKFNDLTNRNAEIIPGQPYYLKQKHNRAPTRYHIAEAGETWWDVSQRFGIKLKKLLRNNRFREEKPLEANLVLWLRYIRPKTVPVEYRDTPQFPENPTLADRQKPESEVINTPPSTSEATASVSSSDPSSERAWRNPSDSGAKTSGTAGDLEKVASETVVAEAEPLVHTVLPKETLFSIARQYNLTAAELAGQNQISVYETLKAGQKLRIPPTAEAQTNTDAHEYHEVSAGETMYQIAQKYRISMRELMQWNQKENFNISVGEQLRIASPNP
ncbi:MAG: LysM peptidoglycan-binding domain-containing protein [Cyclobacteriaceae bacterium]